LLADPLEGARSVKVESQNSTFSVGRLTGETAPTLGGTGSTFLTVDSCAQAERRIALRAAEISLFKFDGVDLYGPKLFYALGRGIGNSISIALNGDRFRTKGQFQAPCPSNA
jgi:hypothetical protein